MFSQKHSGGPALNDGPLSWFSAPDRWQKSRIQVCDNSRQCCDVVFVFSAFQRVFQYGADVIGINKLHLLIRVQALAFFNALVERDDIMMARITMQICDQGLHIGGWAFDPLEEDPAAENQHPGDAARDIALL